MTQRINLISQHASLSATVFVRFFDINGNDLGVEFGGNTIEFATLTINTSSSSLYDRLIAAGYTLKSDIAGIAIFCSPTSAAPCCWNSGGPKSIAATASSPGVLYAGQSLVLGVTPYQVKVEQR